MLEPGRKRDPLSILVLCSVLTVLLRSLATAYMANSPLLNTGFHVRRIKKISKIPDNFPMMIPKKAIPSK
jgi:hypothetical protein